MAPPFSTLLEFFAPRKPSGWQHQALADRPSVAYAIGDVHGCRDLLRGLEQAIQADADTVSGDKLIIMLGDYVDRGPHSADVLDHLMGRPPEGFDRICLVGNHEAMMLAYLNEPSGKDNWLALGGLETLRSYGLRTEELLRLSKSQRKRMIDAHIPTEHHRFLASLTLSLSMPGATFVHAGVRQGVALARQSIDDLLWSRPTDFAEPDTGLVVHGHTAAVDPVITPHRICVDTGAFATGCLSAVRLEQGHPPRILTSRN